MNLLLMLLVALGLSQPANAAVMHPAPCPIITPNKVAYGVSTETIHTRMCVIGTDVYGVTSETAPFDRQHELAHAFDYEHLTPALRDYLTRLMGLSGEWYRARRAPAEWFADYYAACTTGLRGVYRRGRRVMFDWVDSYAPWPGRRSYRRICATVTALQVRYLAE